MSRRAETRRWLAAALLLAAVFAVPLFVPPAGTVGQDASGLLARVFPGVPTTWLLVRLLALLLSALAFARAVTAAPIHAGEPPSPTVRHPLWLHAALVVAVLLFAAATMAEVFGRTAQVVFILGLALPAILVRASEGRRWPSAGRVSAVVLAFAVLFAAWIVVGVDPSEHDPRAATPVDTWLNFKAFRDSISDGRNLLTGRFEPGASDLAHLLTGAPLLEALNRDATFAWMFAASIFWIAMTAAAVGALAARCYGAPAAVVAVAGVLFSPAFLWLTRNPAPFALATALLAALFLCFHGWMLQRSPAALVALGTLGGLAAAFGHTAVPALALGAATGVSLLARRETVSWRVVAVAVFAAAAAALPILPGHSDLVRMQASYLDRFLPWELAERALFGQLTPYVLRDVHGSAPAAEVALGAVLAPFATARTGLRLWGDVFIEPLTIVLGTAGLVVAATGRLGRSGRLFAALLVVSLLPGLTSSYDRPSLVRMLGVAVCMPLLAAGAFRLLAGHGRHQWPAAVGLAAVIAASGWFLFDRTNPRILAQSWVTIAIDACSTRPSDCVLLDYDRGDELAWLNVAAMAGEVPAEPMRVRPFTGDAVLLDADGGPIAPALLWSPALEADAGVAARVARQWPGARFLVLRDRAGISQAFAAAWSDDWQPAIAAEHWNPSPPDVTPPWVR